ncbi:MAG: hypothetical protein M3Z17_12420 [Gemmatimonadota bacterium]|nr:hypothetical protein [Gemmatimonadota bacterium]
MRNFFIALASICVATTAAAQGSLSVQGFGYPPGQMSTRAEGMGGGPSELDPASALNPASVVDVGPMQLYFQYDPEFRTVDANGKSSKTTTARFPLVSFILPLSSRLSFGAGASTLVDRSSSNKSTVLQVIDTTAVRVTQTVKVLGAIDDVRFALGYAVSPSFRIGLGAHLITGTNQLTLIQRFPDSAKFTNVTEASRISYTGTAISGGFELHPSKLLALGVTARKGGNIRAHSGDTTVANAKAPDHYGASVEYTGWGGVSLAAHAGRDQWTSMRALASPSVTAYDSWDIGGGIEADGPHILGRASLARLGVRHRTLPFSTTGSSVSELSIGGGLGIELARNRARLDVGLLHAGRSSGTAMKEHAYIFSFGLRVVP